MDFKFGSAGSHPYVSTNQEIESDALKSVATICDSNALSIERQVTHRRMHCVAGMHGFRVSEYCAMHAMMAYMAAIVAFASLRLVGPTSGPGLSIPSMNVCCPGVP